MDGPIAGLQPAWLERCGASASRIGVLRSTGAAIESLDVLAGLPRTVRFQVDDELGYLAIKRQLMLHCNKNNGTLMRW